MTSPITLSFVGLHPTAELESELACRLQAIEDDFGDLADWYVSVESCERDGRLLFQVRVTATLAGGEIVTDPSPDWWTRIDCAIRDGLARTRAALARRDRPSGAAIDRPLHVAEAQPEGKLDVVGLLHGDIGRRLERLRRSFPGIHGYSVNLEPVAGGQRAVVILDVGEASLVSARTVLPASDRGLEAAARSAYHDARRQAVRYAARRQSRPLVDLHEPPA